MLRTAHNHLQAARLADFAAKILGYAHSGGVLREARDGAAAGRAVAGAAARGREADRRGSFAAGDDSTVCEHDLSGMRRARTTRHRHHGHVRRLLLVLLSLLRPAQRESAV